MLKVNKEGTKTIYEYDCEDREYSKTGLCKDMMESSSTCKCKSGTQKYEIFGGGGSTPEGGRPGQKRFTEYQSILRLHVKCNNNRMSWGVTAKRCPIKDHDINCVEDDRRRRLLYGGGRGC